MQSPGKSHSRAHIILARSELKGREGKLLRLSDCENMGSCVAVTLTVTAQLCLDWQDENIYNKL